MSGHTAVSDFIQNKINDLKKDEFLLQTLDKPFYVQRKLISEEIKKLNQHMSTLKKDKNSYEVVDGKKQFKSPINQDIKITKKVIINYQEYLRYITLLNSYSNRKENNARKIEFESSNVQISTRQTLLFDSIDENNLSNVELNDLVSLCKYMIQNCEAIDDKSLLLKMIKEINIKYINRGYLDEDYVAISSIKCLLGYKISSLEKKNPKRSFLNEIKKYIKSVLEKSEQHLEEEHDYRYEVVEYLIENEIYFNRLLEQMPDIVNLTDKDGYTLSYNVLSKYLDACLRELQDKKVTHLKEKYSKIYRKIVLSPYYVHKNSDWHQIDVMLNNFKETVKSGKFKRKKHVEILNGLENILVEPSRKSKSLIDYDIAFLEEYEILHNQPELNERDLTSEYTIVIDKDSNYHNLAYSLDKSILKIHITDIRKYVKKGSELDCCLKNSIFSNSEQWLNERIMDKISLTKDSIKPVITFEIRFSENGNIEGLEIYKSVISVNEISTFDKINQLDKNSKIYGLVNFLNNECKDPVETIKYYNYLLLYLVGAYFYSNKLPYIYRIHHKQDDNKYIKDMVHLNQLFSKLSKDDYLKFYEIVCENKNSSIYSNTDNYEPSLKEQYYTDLLIPMYSYVGIYLQDLIDEFYIKKNVQEILMCDLSPWHDEIDDIIERANEIKEEQRENKREEKIKTKKEKKYE